MSKIVLIIPNRFSSTRLFGKALLPICGKPAMQWIVERIIPHSKFVHNFVIALTDNKLDDEIIGFCWRNNYDYMRGSEYDVLDRYVKAAEYTKADIIVDITPDCPLVDSRHVDHLVSTLIDKDLDYVSNDVINRFLPDGCDIQVCKVAALKTTSSLITDRNYRMNGTWNIPTCGDHLFDQAINEGLQDKPIYLPNFRIKHIKGDPKYYLPQLGLTLDTKEDYIVLRAIFNEMLAYGTNFKVEDAIDWVLTHPDILEINNNVKRNIPGSGK